MTTHGPQDGRPENRWQAQPPGASEGLFNTGPATQPTPLAARPVQEPWPGPVKPRPAARAVLNTAFLGGVSVVVVGVLLYFAARMGPQVFILCALLALVPLAICLLVLHWIDRWEPEPRLALLGAFLWGAGASVAVSLLVGGVVTRMVIASVASADPTVVSAVLQAPLVEETAKGIGVLLLFFLRRPTFNGPVDGIVYAGTVAAGFAFTENIIYFYSAVSDSGTVGRTLVQVFILRGLLSPFAHVMFTGSMGAILGLAARYGNTPAALLAWAAGLIPAVALHALWNSSTLISQSFLAVYIVLQLPLFLLAVLAIVLMRRAESRLTFQRLGDYVPSGWLTAQEVGMLATGQGRRLAIRWARGFDADRIMRRFAVAATRLAFARQRIVVGKDVPRNRLEEQRLLQDIAEARQQLFARLDGGRTPG